MTIAAVGHRPVRPFWHWTFSANGGFVLAGAGRWRATTGAFPATVLTFVVAARHARGVVAVAARRRLSRSEGLAVGPRPVVVVDTGAVSVVAGFRFFGHYWLQVIPPACLLAAPLAVRLHRGCDALPRPVSPYRLAAFAAAWTPSTFRHLPSPDRLAAYVDAHSRPGHPVMVWGTFPEVYWAADRPARREHGPQRLRDRQVRRAAVIDPRTIADATPGAHTATCSASCDADRPT